MNNKDKCDRKDRKVGERDDITRVPHTILNRNTVLAERIHRMMAHLNTQIPNSSGCQNYYISKLKFKRGRRSVCVCFIYFQSYLSLCNVLFSSAYRCLWAWYAGSLVKEFTQTVNRCLPVSQLFVSVFSQMCFEFLCGHQACAFPLVTQLMGVLGELDEALHNSWNKD